jgi:hypothetical protein
MNELKLKSAIIYPNKIVLLKKKGNIIIHTEDIVSIDYDKPTLWNFIVRAPAIGYLRVFIKDKPLKAYYIKMKYQDVVRLPEFYRKKIGL